MRDCLFLTIHLIVTLVKLIQPGGTRALVAESVLLKHQLLISNRSRSRAPSLNACDRFLLGLASLLVHKRRLTKLAVLVKPSTILKFHKALVRHRYQLLFSSCRFRRKPGPKAPSVELIKIIIDLKRRNPRFGCVRIAQQISYTFGVDIDKDVVRRVLAQHYRPEPGGGDGPSWLSLIAHTKDSLWSVDLFRCQSVSLRSHWVMVVMDVFTRRIVGFGVEPVNVDGISVCRMFNDSINGQSLPKHVGTDNDPLFRSHRWLANLRILEISEIKSVPHVPVSHPFVERLIGTIRREHLDQTWFWNRLDLLLKLNEFRAYYNADRVHRSLDGTTPAERAGVLPHPHAQLGCYRWRGHCRGLFQIPIAA